MNTTKIDHLILGINDLDRGIELFAQKTGITPRFGGHHPDLGTHNALVSLGNGAYLEILAPKDKSVPTKAPFNGLENFNQLTPCGWAITVSDIDIIIDELSGLGSKVMGPVPGSRKSSEGITLQWRAAFIQSDDGPTINPFFSNWSELTIHPSITEPGGCTLNDFEISGSEDEPLIKLLRSMSLNFRLTPSVDTPPATLLGLSLHSPAGIVTLSV